MSEFYIPKDIDVLKIDLSEHDAKIRANAIDEFVFTFEKEFAPNLDENLITMIEFNKWFENVTKIAEQLKEQKK